MNCLAKKEYKLPIVKQLVGMWQQCGLLQFVCKGVTPEVLEKLKQAVTVEAIEGAECSC